MYKYKVTDLNGDGISVVQSGDEYPGAILTGLRTYADVNGDWFPDYIQGTTVYSGCFGSNHQDNEYDYWLYFNARLDLGYGFTGPVSTSTTSLPPLGVVSCGGTGPIGYVGGLWADVNGDGLIDVMQNNTTVLITPKRYINKSGLGTFAGSSIWIPPAPTMTSGTSNNLDTNLVDLNNDGLADFYYLGSGSTYNAIVNNSSGFATSTNWNYTATGSPSMYDNGVRILDINGDDLPDIVRSYHTDFQYGSFNPPPYAGTSTVNEVYINTGNGFVLSTSTVSTTFATFTGGSSYGQGQPVQWNGEFSYYYPYDANGDGLVDIGQYSVPKKADMLASITSSTGAVSSIEYTPSPQQMQGGQMLNPKLPLIIYTPTHIVTTSGTDIVSDTGYSYAGGLTYFASSTDRTFAGFAIVTATTSSSTIKTYYHQGNTTNTTLGEYDDVRAKIGKPYRTEVYDASNNLYQTQITKWDKAVIANASTFVFPAQTVTLTYDGTASHRDSAVAYTYDNSTGNVLTKTEYGEVTGSNDGTFTDNIGTDARTTTYTYASSAGSTVIGLPSDEVVTDQSSTKVKETRHYYDGLSLGSISLGNETKTEGWKSGTSYASTTKTYNSYGLVTQSTDARGGRTLYGYDSYNLFVASTTDAAGLNTQYLYNYAIGKPKQTTDPNGLVFQTVYDGLGRPTQELQPDLTTPSTLVTKTTYAYVDTALNVSVHKTVSLDGSLTHDMYEYFDGLGRSIQTREQAESANTYAVKDKVYDTRGNVWKESLPYFSSGTSRTSSTSYGFALHHIRL